MSATAPFDDLGPAAVTRRYPAGTAMFHAGDPSDWVALIRRGQVKVVEQTADSREVLLAVRGPGQLIGELSAIDGEPRSATAVAIDDVEVQMVDAAAFHRHLVANPDLALALLRLLSLRLRDADRKRVEYSSHDVLGRVCRRLSELADEYGVPDADGVRITLRLTQDELASYTAASREAVAKALRSLRSRGMVTTERRSITITDLDGLRKRAG